MSGPSVRLRGGDASRPRLDRRPRAEPGQRPAFFARGRPTGTRPVSPRPDKRYLVFEDAEGARRGFAILTGLRSPERAVELVRIAVDAPGQGLGTAALSRLVAHVFDGLGRRAAVPRRVRRQRARPPGLPPAGLPRGAGAARGRAAAGRDTGQARDHGHGGRRATGNRLRSAAWRVDRPKGQLATLDRLPSRRGCA